MNKTGIDAALDRSIQVLKDIDELLPQFELLLINVLLAGTCIAGACLLALMPIILGLNLSGQPAGFMLSMPGVAMMIAARLLFKTKFLILAIPAFFLWTCAAIYGLAFGSAQTPMPLLASVLAAFAIVGLGFVFIVWFLLWLSHHIRSQLERIWRAYRAQSTVSENSR